MRQDFGGDCIHVVVSCFKVTRYQRHMVLNLYVLSLFLDSLTRDRQLHFLNRRKGENEGENDLRILN